VFAKPPASGTYYMVLSNKFSGITPKSVGAKVQLMWVPTALIEAQQHTAQGLKVMIVLCLIALAGVLVMLWSSLASTRKRKSAAEPERKAA
jgi:hypothetical protein